MKHQKRQARLVYVITILLLLKILRKKKTRIHGVEKIHVLKAKHVAHISLAITVFKLLTDNHHTQ